MKREEAIEWLTDIKENITENWSHDVAIDMAIEALSAELTATNTEKSSNCGDLISRADAIEAVASADETNGTIKVFSGLEIIDMLNALPSADTVSREFYEATIKANHGLAKENIELKEQIESADRPSGEWVQIERSIVKAWSCSKCGNVTSQHTDYCAVCGAKMRNNK